MIRYALALVVFGVSAEAEPLSVRSGEHAGFSRIVVTLEDHQSWTFGRDDEGYALRVEPDLDGFSTQGIFDRIPRKRVISVERAADALYLQVSPDVHAEVMELDGHRVVIDIKDGAPVGDSPFEQPLVDATPKTSLVQLPVIPHTAILAVEAHDAPFSDLFGVGALASHPSRSTESDDHETRLYEAVSRAATEGLLDEEIAYGDSAERSVSAALDMNLSGHFSIQTPYQDVPSFGVANMQIAPHCIDEDQVDISSWGDSAATPEFGDRLAATVGEFDETDPSAIRAMVRYYLYFTFGTEARALLDSFEADIEGDDVLKVMADIMENESAADPGPFADQMECPGGVALWTFLANPAMTKVDKPSILEVFANYPVHLRRQLGPLLAQRFAGAGDLEAAQRIISATHRAGGGSQDATKLVEAEMLVASDHANRAVETLTSIPPKDITGARALIARIDLLYDSRSEISEGLAQTAADFLPILEEGPLLTDMRFAEAKALIANGKVADALDRLDHPEGGRLASELANDAYLAAARDLDDFDFATLIFERLGRLETDGAGRATLIALAERASALNFDAEAQYVKTLLSDRPQVSGGVSSAPASDAIVSPQKVETVHGQQGLAQDAAELLAASGALLDASESLRQSIRGVLD